MTTVRTRDADLPVVVEGVTKHWGAVTALDRVDLTVRRATIHGLVGPNGSGKTTLLNVLSGLVRADEGSVHVFGRAIGKAPAFRTARLGVGRTFQTPRVFNELSVWENIRVGTASPESTARDEWLHSRLAAMRDDLDRRRPDILPHGAQRLLEILRVVSMSPRLLLMDEPAAGLSAQERRGVAALCQRIRDDLGIAVVLVEHDLRMVWNVADQVSVLDGGRVVETGEPEALRGKASIASLFVGDRDA